jgi:IPT/TIG domain-containing protein
VITFASRIQLFVTVPADAATGPITVQTDGGSTDSAATFEVIADTPIISDVNPKNGTVGTEVTLTGTALKADTGPTVVTFAGGNKLSSSGAGHIRYADLSASARAKRRGHRSDRSD